MERDVECQARIIPPEQPRRQRKVCGAADRQEFRKTLKDAKNGGL
jgi:hypothetical protein